MSEPEAAVIIDPVEEALADQFALWGDSIVSLEKSIATEEDHLSRLKSSRDDKREKRAAIKQHLDDNFEGWDVRLADRSELQAPAADEPKPGRKRAGS